MLVHDSLQVGDQTAQAGITAGPIWHLGPVAPPLTGGDRGAGQWVLSQNASVNLFAQFSLEPRPEALHVGVQCVDVWSKENQQTAYANVTLTAGRHSFVSLLVPARIADVPRPQPLRPIVRTLKSTCLERYSDLTLRGFLRERFEFDPRLDVEPWFDANLRFDVEPQVVRA